MIIFQYLRNQPIFLILNIIDYQMTANIISKTFSSLNLFFIFHPIYHSDTRDQHDHHLHSLFSSFVTLNHFWYFSIIPASSPLKL